jgi:hypothetical protein
MFVLEPPLDKLRHTLAETASGPISGASIEGLLADAWDELTGSGDQSMTGFKLLGRTEAMMWNPPELVFQIERHGGTVMGSTRAEVHVWTVNVDDATAECSEARGVRQLRAPAKAVRAEPLVDDVAAAVVQQQPHPALVWVTPRRVRVLPKHLPGLDTGYKQTLAGRRRRFVDALSQRIAPLGWARVAAGSQLVYEHSDA